MADFTQNTNVKSAVRKLVNPISDVTAFNAIVESVIQDNPFGCVSYMSSGVNHPPVEKTRESYTAKFVYQSSEGTRVGTSSENYNTISGYTAGIPAVLANTANNTAHGGSIIRNQEGDSFSATLRCHAANGELFQLNISRQQVTLSSYEDDAIRTVIETWADGVAALG